MHAIVTCRTLHLQGCCVKVTGIAPYIPLCHHPFYESVKLCSFSCIPQFQRPQVAPVLPLTLSQPVQSPKKWGLAQLVRSLHQCAGRPWCCVCVLACMHLWVWWVCLLRQSTVPEVPLCPTPQTSELAVASANSV